MRVIDRIDELQAKLGLSDDQLAKQAGIGNKFSKWRDGKYNPSLRSVETLAAFFGVPVSDLLVGNSADASGTPLLKSEILSRREQKLLEAFRGLSDEGQDIVINQTFSLAALYPREREKKKAEQGSAG